MVLRHNNKKYSKVTLAVVVVVFIRPSKSPSFPHSKVYIYIYFKLNNTEINWKTNNIQQHCLCNNGVNKTIDNMK